MVSLLDRVRVFLLGLRIFRERTLQEPPKSYLRDGIEPRRYGLVLTDRQPTFRDYKIVYKMTFHFDSDGIFHYQKGVSRVGQGVDTMLVIWLDSALAIYNGRFRPPNSRDYLPYDIWTSARLGHLKWEGEASSSDIKHFADLLTRRPEIKARYLKGVEEVEA